MSTTRREVLEYPGGALQRGDDYYLLRLEQPAQFPSSAPLGEGLLTASWVLSGQVNPRGWLLDPEAYLRRLASSLGVTDRPDGSGMVGLLTAVDHRDLQVSSRAESGVTVTILATVGVDHGSSPRDKDVGGHGEPGTAEPVQAIQPGTINLVALIDADLSPGALVLASTVATEAKTLAMVEAGVTQFVEFGGKVLTPMVKRIAPDADAISVVTMDDIEDLLKRV